MARTPFILVFTDLDGTLLDHETYEWEEAKPALNLCKQLDVPVILVSSKTRSEMVVLWQHLDLKAPFISENGGGIFFPADINQKLPPHAVYTEGIWKWSLGVSYERLVWALNEIREESGLSLRGFSDMTPEEISRLTGLDMKSATLALQREYDEPFLVMENGNIDTEVLYESARRRGLHITRGGRFYHLQGNMDKGEAIGKVISWYQEKYLRVLSIALGDSPNDFSMFKRVDYPVLIRSSKTFKGIEREIPGVRVTQEMGPKGWNKAVLDLLYNRIHKSH